MAFDHEQILAVAVERIRGKLDYAPIGFEVLPERFTLLELRRVHEAILGRPLNKDSFRRKVIDRGLVEPTGERATGLGHRPPELYRFAGPPAGGPQSPARVPR
jgi:8-oxo-dGTP diphosphatase